MQTNTAVQWNFATFNIPTLVGLLGIGVMVFNAGQAIQLQNSRITNIELSRSEKMIGYSKLIDTVDADTVAIANLVYRVTIAEQGIIAVNARVDRQTDNMQDFRGDLAKVNTSIELLTQQIKQNLPDKKAELDTLPPALARTP